MTARYIRIVEVRGSTPLCSGGSTKNWTSVVDGGSVVVLGKVSRNLYDAECDNLPCGVTCEIVNNEHHIDRAALEEEKKRLEARIDEINKLLA